MQPGIDMQRTPPFPFLPDFEMPLRDAMRGVANLAEATEEALKPVAVLLPEPLGEGFRNAVRTIESTGKRLIVRPLQHDQLVEASNFAMGKLRGARAARTFAKVFCFAWEHIQDKRAAPRYLISETLIAGEAAFMHPDRPTPPPAFAAELVDAIRKSAAIGRIPGLATNFHATEKSDIDMALVTIMVWLLAARAASVTEDLTLLDLAGALVAVTRPDIEGAIRNPEELVVILQNTSTHL